VPVSVHARQSTREDGAGPGRGGATRRAFPPLGRGQGLLLAASIGIMVGSFLPWVDTIAGRFWGMQGAGVWTFYAGAIGLAGGLVARRWMARASGVIVTAAAIGLPAWQVLHLANTCDWQVCMPATGLAMVGALGLVTARATYLLGRPTT